MGNQPHSVCLTLRTEGGQDQRLGPERPSLWHLEGSLEPWAGLEEKGSEGGHMGSESLGARAKATRGQGAQPAGSETCKAVPRERERMAQEQW